ncbi:MAG: tetratricopeptide repeat protein [Nannocystales bacterium]
MALFTSAGPTSVAVLLLAVVGCAGKAPDVTAAPTPAEVPSVDAAEVAAVDPEPEGPCRADADCADEGRALAKAGDDAGARALFQHGCDAGGMKSCDALASAVDDEDPELALTLWGKACEHGVTASCFNAAEKRRESDPSQASALYAKACTPDLDDAVLRSLACSRGALTAYSAGDYGNAKAMAEVICTAESVSGCGLLGVIHAQGLGVKADVDRARAYLDQGCKGGDQEACDNLGKVDAALDRDRIASVLPVEGANVSIGSIAVDGLSASNLQCRRDGGGGLFGGAMGAISGISKRKKKLMKCASKPEDVRVRWNAEGGKIKAVEVKASSPKVEACVKKAVKGAMAAFGGTCAATFSIGG